MARAYWRIRGQASKTKLIGRARGYHGVNIAGTALGGIGGNRKTFGPLLPGVDHLPHTHNLEKNAYTAGEPEYGTHLADELERIVALHDASTIAAARTRFASSSMVAQPRSRRRRITSFISAGMSLKCRTRTARKRKAWTWGAVRRTTGFFDM